MGDKVKNLPKIIGLLAVLAVVIFVIVGILYLGSHPQATPLKGQPGVHCKDDLCQEFYKCDGKVLTLYRYRYDRLRGYIATAVHQFPGELGSQVGLTCS